MFNDDDDESAVSAVRYPCMPSLVSLQQMKNRLHLAYLGRKLMKWTAMATGRELRHIGAEINRVYKSFGDDMSNAFMLLARARYFYPNLNKMVVQNPASKTSVLVTSCIKTISGVKVLEYNLLESGVEPYEHLGIEKGGQQIHEAKVAWLELLKRLVLMLELRNNFVLVHEAHKSATKRQNVLGRVVVPRTNATIVYIKSELEELAREEFFRVKRMLRYKMKNKRDCGHKERREGCDICKNKFKDEETCPICHNTMNMLRIAQEKAEFLSKKDSKTCDSMLEVYKRNISDIIELTHDVKGKGITPQNFDKFLTTASELRNKLEIEERLKQKLAEQAEKTSSGESIKEACEACVKRFKEEQAKQLKQDELEEEATISTVKKEPKGLQLGVFETEYEQITKIIRTKNIDGSVNEERKVIKRKKEKKVKPKAQKSDDGASLYRASGTSAKSSAYPSNTRSVGLMLIQDTSILKGNKKFAGKHLRAKSETIMYASSMVCPVIRNCISSASMKSSIACNFSCITIIGNREQNRSDLTIQELLSSSSEIQIAANFLD